MAEGQDSKSADNATGVKNEIKDAVGDATQVGTKAMGELTKLALKAMVGAPPLGRFGVFIDAAYALVAIVLLVTPPYEIWKPVVLAITIPVYFLLTMILVARYAGVETRWTGELTGPQRMAVRSILDNARQVVRDALRTTDSHLDDKNIRANIFFPTNVKEGRRRRKMLKIDPILTFNMNAEQERHIAFEIGKGATGLAFKNNAALVAQRRDSPEGDWDEIYQITPAQAAVIHPELKWILSMPIKGPGKEPIGIVNVDGLHSQYGYDKLVECEERAGALVSTISQLLLGR